MSLKRAAAIAVAVGVALGGVERARAGPYDEPGYLPGVVEAWATAIAVPDGFDPGPIDIADPMSPDASFGEPEDALGPVDGDNLDVVSLGDGGSITFFFASGIPDEPGDDFAVYENGFYAPGGLFSELAFVEVSSNRVDFARFPAASLRATPVAGGGVIDPTDYHNLAGKHPIDRGTGFDLAVLASDPLVIGGQVDLDQIFYVRLVDVVGNGSTLDAAGRPVYDPYPTAFESGGFDANAVGVPEPDRTLLMIAGAASVGALSRFRRPCAPPR